MKCRVCDSGNLIPYIDLGLMPLSNNLLSEPGECERFPLKVLFCKDCGLSQLSTVIDPMKLFGHYVYRSSISQGYKNHCRDMAISIKKRLDSNSLVIDIAGNDGALLDEFKHEIGCRVLNVDPAENLKAICEGKDIPVISKFWSKSVALDIVDEYGHADVITATNVFAHVDNVKEFMQGIKLALKPKGILIIEFPYLIDFIENKEFDTIYFEHLSYFSVRPLLILCADLGLNILSVEKQDIHGGSVRVTIGQGMPDHSVTKFISDELPYSVIEPYYQFAEDVQIAINKFRYGLKSLSGSTAAFAASAKGNILLNSAQITSEDILYIVDQTPEKIDRYSPGTNIPIVGMDILQQMPPDNLIILSWNFASEIMSKCRNSGYRGTFIIPIPEFAIIPSLYAQTTQHI